MVELRDEDLEPVAGGKDLTAHAHEALDDWQQAARSVRQTSDNGSKKIDALGDKLLGR